MRYAEGRPSMPSRGKGAAGPRRFLITSALPYANGDIHLGHLVEAVQTDIYARFQKLRGNEVVYVCADDTHGTPIELSALKQGISPEELIARTWENHVRDYAAYSIGFDIFYSTNSPENRAYAERIYAGLRERGLVVEKEIEQYYDEEEQRFLPDRFIKGTCPRCGADDQYGDVCESCGATYNPTELTNPRSVVSGKTPVLRKSTHLFVQLARCEDFLRNYIAGRNVLADDMRNFVSRWIEDGLREWCISRDGPYFGFPIPGTENKFFYVWLDAPIGYLSSTAKWCGDNGRDVLDFWGADAPGELVHFIGKDIVYFHALFWPVMLDAAGFKLPSRMFVHGFLTVQDEKMSKTRGTFILAREYALRVKHPQACEYLRFYYGAKLTNNAGDIGFNIDEFCNRINTVLINNIGNLHHRTFVFIDRYFDGMVPDASWDASIAAEVENAAGRIARHFENGEYRAAIEKIHALGSRGNKYYQDTKPWELVKSDRERAAEVMVTCANLIRSLAVFLKPVVPNLVAALERQYGAAFAWDDYRFSLRGAKTGKTEKLVRPIAEEDFADLLGGAAAEPVGKQDAGPRTRGDDMISSDDFSKVDLRIGTIERAEAVQGSDKLVRLEVNDGEGGRQLVAGIGKHYDGDSLAGKQVVFVANLKPARLMGVLSQGMVLAAQHGAGLSLLAPDGTVDPGAKVS
ncbi:MAG: methionine--tRNA ligase [Chitinivibrionales bacterium]|nr:methionine--tRNA ligase [Chitinivibrionales bacterium]MBD3395006.1 methionine--tRNA ligase [Chitinivibrionales bacterium]